MIYSLSAFDIAFPIGLGVLFGLARYARMAAASAPDALRRASMDALKGALGAGIIIFAYKSLGII
jgi:hypothetical protein